MCGLSLFFGGHPCLDEFGQKRSCFAGGGFFNAGVADSQQAMWSEQTQRTNLRRNYVAMALDGGFYFGGIAFVAPESVLPAILKELGGPVWLVALAPTLAMVGFFLGPLFTAHIVERRSTFRPYVVWVSVPQRLPPLVAGLVLILLAGRYPHLALWAVALSPLLVSLFGGATVPGFWELFAKVIPAKRRSSNLAIRNVLGTVFGVVAGGIIAAVLARWPGAPGYGVLHLGCFALLMMSLVALVQVRELPHVPRPAREREGWLETLKMLPRSWACDRSMRLFVMARIFGIGVGILTPFLAVHALAVLDKPASFLGSLVIAQSLGAIAGNLVAGWLGDRFGGRIVGTLGGVTGAIMCLGAIVNSSGIGFLAIFFLLGASKFLWMTGSNTLMLELFPEERRPTYVAITSVLTLPAMLLSAWGAGALWSAFGAIWPAALAGAVLVAAGLFFLVAIPEPRARVVQP